MRKKNQKRMLLVFDKQIIILHCVFKMFRCTRTVSRLDKKQPASQIFVTVIQSAEAVDTVRKQLCYQRETHGSGVSKQLWSTVTVGSTTKCPLILPVAEPED